MRSILYLSFLNINVLLKSKKARVKNISSEYPGLLNSANNKKMKLISIFLLKKLVIDKIQNAIASAGLSAETMLKVNAGDINGRKNHMKPPPFIAGNCKAFDRE